MKTLLEKGRVVENENEPVKKKVAWKIEIVPEKGKEKEKEREK